MIEQATAEKPLASFVSSFGDPAVVRLGIEEALVLLGTADGDVMVWLNGTVRSFPDVTPAELVVNPAQHDALLRSALLRLDFLRHINEMTTQSDAGCQIDELVEVRDYAIDAHERGLICRPGLNEFLDHFNLGEYEADDEEDDDLEEDEEDD
jgi:hypothetical protein